MKENLNCDIQIINDAIVMGSDVCTILQKCIDTIKEGGKVIMYDEYKAPVNYRKDLIFDNVEDFVNWVNQHYPNLGCSFDI